MASHMKRRPILVLFTLWWYSLVITSIPSSHAQNGAVLSQDHTPSRNVQGFNEKETVVIINDLGDGLRLHYHCKSRDDDLGYRNLAPGKSWSFRFEPNFWGTTLFFCRFWWKGESHWFDIYDDSRDNVIFKRDRCAECKWRMRKSGPCRFKDRTKEFDLCYGWKKHM